MSIMNVMSITLITLIIGAMLALYLGVQAASAEARTIPAPTTITAPTIVSL